MILTGTVHFDIEGPKRLEYLLNKLRPRRITIECPKNVPPDEFEEICLKKNSVYVRAVQSLGLPPALEKLFSEYYSGFGYDVVIPLAYARGCGTELYAIDDPSLVEKLGLYQSPDESSFSKSFRLALGDLPPSAYSISHEELRRRFAKAMDMAYYDFSAFRKLYQSAVHEIKQMTEQLSFLDDAEWAEKREHAMAQEIMSIGPDLHIGGMLHTFDYPDYSHAVMPLYRRLGGALSERIRLCEAFNY